MSHSSYWSLIIPSSDIDWSLGLDNKLLMRFSSH
jgi:hypothetical protein